MKALTIRHLRDVTIGAGLLFGVAACTWQGLKPEAGDSRTLYLSGHSSHVSDGRIAKIAAPFLKASYFDMDLAGLTAALSEEPWLTDIEVAKRFPGGVSVHVADRKPVAYWGTEQLVDAQGRVFKPRSRPDGLVSLNGPETQSEKVYAQYRALSGILAGQRAYLSSLTLDTSGDWRARLNNGLELRLGREQVAERMQRFVQFALNRSAADAALADAGYVDLRYSDGFAVGGTRTKTASRRGQESMG